MKKIVTIGLLLFASIVPTITDASASGADKKRKGGGEVVYICTSPNAYAYHGDRYCPLLNRCDYSIKAVSKSQAVKMGRRGCQKC